MTSTSVSVAAAAAAPLSVVSSSATKASAITRAAHDLLLHLERGQRIDAPMLRTAMENAFGASDADGGWDWKTAYDACEAATVLFVRKFGPAMRARAASPAAMLPMLAKIAGLLPTHTRRSEESEALQQFSSPIVLGLAAEHGRCDHACGHCAGAFGRHGSARHPGRTVRRVPRSQRARRNPRGASLAPLSRHHCHRASTPRISTIISIAGIKPSVVLMNPPFSAVANVDRRMADAALRHIASALARLPEGGRLVAITGASCSPDNPVWPTPSSGCRNAGASSSAPPIAGAVFAKHGTTIETRLTVIDRLPADDATAFPSSLGVAPDVATLLGWVTEYVPARLPIATAVAIFAERASAHSANRPRLCHAPVQHRVSRIGCHGDRTRL